MNAALLTAIRKIDGDEFNSLDEILDWARTSDGLTGAERAALLGSTVDEIRFAAGVVQTQNLAEYDQQLARADALDALADALERHAADDRELIGETLSRLRSVDPAEHARVQALAALAFPGGNVDLESGDSR